MDRIREPSSQREAEADGIVWRSKSTKLQQSKIHPETYPSSIVNTACVHGTMQVCTRRRKFIQFEFTSRAAQSISRSGVDEFCGGRWSPSPPPSVCDTDVSDRESLPKSSNAVTSKYLLSIDGIGGVPGQHRFSLNQDDLPTITWWDFSDTPQHDVCGARMVRQWLIEHCVCSLLRCRYFSQRQAMFNGCLAIEGAASGVLVGKSSIHKQARIASWYKTTHDIGRSAEAATEMSTQSEPNCRITNITIIWDVVNYTQTM